MAGDPEIGPTIEIYANDQAFFFATYSTAFEKMLNLTVTPLTLILTHAVDLSIVAQATAASNNRVTLNPMPPRRTHPGPATGIKCGFVPLGNSPSVGTPFGR
ncbi:hypothetical protein BDK51DRAFT_28969 [Blyttiomyces helicus]|uniref:Uncharacterized protein n=1 Tax=Blyttiomyces helicus TaxID=388810 RepID=A0A4P9W006_9FUNG|nr:hypothetical protein BDK51DRAFT_28969 [Blyttiomyces helicus]|eukprot:RKO85441.1 hypothetical protein BDK51DRAFT_28969 [Blyttiomyces helicus]